MNTTVEREGKWVRLGEKLEKMVKENLNKPKSERKSLTKLFDDFANEHDTTSSSASYYYYEEIKPKLEAKNIDSAIEAFTHTITDEFSLKFPKDYYKVGDVLDVVVTSITNFGAFVKTKENFEGLIHISEITGKHYVDMPEDFFYIGEKVKAKIIRINADNKIGFSIKAIGGKEKINSAFQKLVDAKPEVEHKQPVENKDDSVVKVQELPKENITPSDKDNIVQFLKKYSDNNVSTKALLDIQEMIENFGVFQTTMSLLEVVRDLDISSFITEKTKEKLSGESLRQR